MSGSLIINDITTLLSIFFSWYQMLNDHVIVRIGGGWDTLEHYIMTHLAKVGKASIFSWQFFI